MGTSEAQYRTEQLLAAANRASGGAWRLKGRLAGGLLGGAWRIEDGSRAAVLKWQDLSSPAPINPDAPAVARHVRAAGYPTPAWLASGQAADGVRWWIQDLVDGEPIRKLDLAAAEHLLTLIRLQRLIRPPTQMNWTDFMRRTVADAPTAWRGLVGRAEPHLTAAIPDDEMVHCDLSLSNILLNEGSIAGVVDLQAAGRGCAVYDLLAAVANGLAWDAEPEAIHRLELFARETYEPPEILLAAACLVVETLTWTTERRPALVEPLSRRFQAWLERL